MSTYMDPEMADVISIACRGLVDMERQMDAVRGTDLENVERDQVHELRTAGLILYGSGEPVAVVRLEDVWPEADILDPDERDVIELVTRIMVNPGDYRVEGTSIIKKD